MMNGLAAKKEKRERERKRKKKKKTDIFSYENIFYAREQGERMRYGRTGCYRKVAKLRARGRNVAKD
jgi:hypothetical protein